MEEENFSDNEIKELYDFIKAENKSIKIYIENYCKEQLDEYFSNKIEFLEDCFNEQNKRDTSTFNTILNLIKDEVTRGQNAYIENLESITKELNNKLKLNEEVSKALINTIKDSYDELEENKIVYSNIKKGIKQYAIQVGITVSIILVILGGFNLIKLFL